MKAIVQMSETLSAQLDTVTATIQEALSLQTKAILAVGQQVNSLHAQLATALNGVSPGSQITQEQIDALTAIATGLGTQNAALTALVTP